MITHYDRDGIVLYQGDCLDVMPYLISQGVKVDAVICDPPYATTGLSWDCLIPFDDMWRNIKALNKPKAATVLFGSQPFTSLLIASNMKDFKYELIWDKGRGREPQLANVRPMKAHENICIFCDGKTTYNPQKTKLDRADKRGINPVSGGKQGIIKSYTNQPREYHDRFPLSVMNYAQDDNIHPTQKPLALMQYLIRTYTNPGDTILDFTSGSGTTLHAAKLEGRKCIGIERDLDDRGNCLGYCEYSVERLRQNCMVFA